jgi:hypothetical protein
MRYKHFLVPIFIFFVTFGIYIHNLSRGVYAGDTGDFITTAIIGGVAHPSGYPLFTFLGFLLTHFLLWSSPAFAVNSISAFSGACGAVIFFLIAKKITKNEFVSLLTSFILSFCYYFWFYSEIAEVFVLNVLLSLVLFYIAFCFREKPTKKTLLFFFFFLGLACTNNQTIILTFPSVILLFLTNRSVHIIKSQVTIKHILIYLFCFLLGMSVYIYIPLASSLHPAVNWDMVHDIPSFIHLFLRRDYGTLTVKFFTRPNIMQEVILLKIYFFSLITQLTIPVFFLSLIGMIVLWKKDKILFLSFFLAFFLSGPCFFLYTGFPIYSEFYLAVYERFFILSIPFLLFFFPFGLLFLSDFFGKFSHIPFIRTSIIGIFLIIPCMLFIYNFSKTDLSQVMIGDNLGYDLMTKLPQNAILFLGGDTDLFNTWYIHYGLGIRRDIEIVNMSGLIQSQFFEDAKKQWEMSHSGEKQYELIGIMTMLQKNHQVFAISQLQMPQKYNLLWIPYGLSFHLTKDHIPENEFIEQTNDIWSHLHIPWERLRKSKAFGSLSIVDIPQSYANAMLITGNFFLSEYKDQKRAKEWYEKALLVDSHYAKTYEVLGVYNLHIEHNCKNASLNFTKALQEDPLEQIAYFLLYTTYKDCLHNTISAEKIAKQFSHFFGTDFIKEFKNTIKENPL